MSDGLTLSRDRRDGVTIPAIWVAYALSLLIHIAVLWQWLPKLHLASPDDSKLGDAGGSLLVRLVPAPSPPPAARLPQPPPTLLPAPRRPQAAARPRPTAPVIALKQPPELQAPAPAAPAPASQEVVAPGPARPPAEGDFASHIAAQRRARSLPAPTTAAGPALPQPVEDEKARSERIVATNLGTRRAQSFGYDPSQGGGVFQILHLGYDSAEFAFFGWNRAMRRNTKQEIEVRKGNNSDIRLAVVRKMISIIREYEQEDFTWDSYRLGRTLRLSARERDNAGLEEFMLAEFFSGPGAPQ